MTDFKLGPLQRHWVETLKAHPERQYKQGLGYIASTGEMHFCCLGQLEMLGRSTTCLFPGYVYKNKVSRIHCNNTFTLALTYENYGLHSEDGAFRSPKNPVVGVLITYKGVAYSSLAGLNDSENVTWLDIAHVIETYPELIFTKAV